MPFALLGFIHLTTTCGLEFPVGPFTVNWRFFGALGAETVILSYGTN